MTYEEEIKQAILKIAKAETPEKLCNILYPFIKQARPTPSCDEPDDWSPEETKAHKNLKKAGRNRAIEMRRENPSLPEAPKEGADISEIVDWCTSCQPKKLMILTLVPKYYHVNQETLRRAIKDERLIEYRDKNNAVMVNTVEVSKRWPSKIPLAKIATE